MKSFNFFGSYSSVSCPIEAITYLDNSGITDPSIRDNVCQFVKELKDEGVWNLIDVLYPYVGANANQNKLNLVNPLDTDAAFRRTFHGGVTFSETTGTQGNGVNGYYLTKYIISVNMTASTGGAFIVGVSTTDGNNTYELGANDFTTNGRAYIKVNPCAGVAFGGAFVNLNQPNVVGISSMYKEPNLAVGHFKRDANSLTTNALFVGSTVEVAGMGINNSGTISYYSNRSQVGAIICKNATTSDIEKIEMALANLNSRR